MYLYVVRMTGSSAQHAGVGHFERLSGEAASPPRKQLTSAELRGLHRYAKMKR